MNKIILTLVLSTVFLSIFSCSNVEQKSVGIDSTKAMDTVSKHKEEVYGINAEDVAIRKGPGLKFEKLINEKATETIGETQYCEVDFSTKVVILEKKKGWVKIKVVDPDWLSDTYIGWIPSDVIITKEDEDKQSLGKLDPKDYEILKTRHNAALENYHVLLNRKKFDKNYAYQFIKAFRKEHCTRNCNVSLYDSKSVAGLIGVYPLEGKDYLKMADHLISISSFDATEVRDWYPYQDFRYGELGGRNWKKAPIN